MPRASAPTRTYGKATLSLGMIQIPIDTYNAKVSDFGISRQQFVDIPVMTEKRDDQGNIVLEDGGPVMVQATREVTADGVVTHVPVFESHSVGVRPYDKTTMTDVEQADIKRKIATDYGHVFVSDDEIERLFDLSPNTIKVLEFQPQHLFSMGHYIPKALLYATPGKTEVAARKKKVLPGTLEAYSIFMAAMKVRGLMAIVEFTNRGVPKPGILLPNGNLWLVHYTEEIREAPSVDLLDVPAEVAEQAASMMALDTMTKTEPRDLPDERSRLIQQFADEKAAAGDFAESTETNEEQEIKAPEVGGFMAMLQAQVEAAKANQEKEAQTA